MSSSIFRKAHGTASEGGAILVAETPPLDELEPSNAARTGVGLALRSHRGRPFTRGNKAAAGRKPSLARLDLDVGENTPQDERAARRKASHLRKHRMRELSVTSGGDLSSAVGVEVASWALATAYSRLAYDRGDHVRGAQLAEKASAHQLKAIGIAEREAEQRPRARGPSPWSSISEPPKGDDK